MVRSKSGHRDSLNGCCIYTFGCCTISGRPTRSVFGYSTGCTSRIETWVKPRLSYTTVLALGPGT
ncbi:hypothetical protein CY34DRAFT_807510 [Suillus luteus UH-Slu-Lm8-n1]|uniref:Unplaced genomic scaffold CY34scaffold_183, whole genome shotgun sequence n=1 Tax=Suillus luteus UH-Slu-Lm8-n1 TaxID=930992 RepID=A0A0D0B0R6_9AGAM|nr:hypothetical protein CY34DRAFT_807510 [Suillus luteus UH-Slu-Lm8-n1]